MANRATPRMWTSSWAMRHSSIRPEDSSPKPGIPFQVSGIAVALLSAKSDEPNLVDALSAAATSGDVPVAPIETLIYLKLKSPRHKDLTDVIELIKAGIDQKRVRSHLDRF